jgi:RAB protein geranylgeranyltransferase component A
MYKELNNSQFDYIVFGSSLSESILSAYLSKLKLKVLHVDFSKFYGGDCKNFNLKDMDSFIKEQNCGHVGDAYLKDFKLVKNETCVQNVKYINITLILLVT